MQAEQDTIQSLSAAEIVASIRESLLVLTEDLDVEYANQQFFDTFRVSKLETVGSPLAKLGNGQWNIPALLEPLDRIVAENTTIEGHEVDHQFEQIGRRVMRLNARKTTRPGNGSRRILLVIEDVTASAESARELERQRRLAQGIVDTMREPLLVLDGDLTVVAASRAFYAKFHVNETDTVGRKLADIGHGQWAIPALIDLLADVIPDNSGIEDFEVQPDFPKIGKRIILLNARKIFRKGNNSKTLLLAMEDITERKQSEDALRSARDDAEATLNELRKAQDRLVASEKLASLGKLTAGIAHEIKNPLNFVCNFSETSAESLGELKSAIASIGDRLGASGRLEIEELTSDLEADLEKIISHAKRADNIVRSMMDHARGGVSQPISTNVNKLVMDAFNLAYHGKRARDKTFNVTVEEKLDEKTGDVLLAPQDINRALVNIFGNAFDAVNQRSKMPDSNDYRPIVVVTTRRLENDIEIRVKDNGIGISEKDSADLFKPFFTTKPAGEGTGLGLSLSFDIVARQHSGTIRAASDPGSFTEFVITLPRNNALTIGDSS